MEPKSLEMSILEELKCPICFYYMSPPIRQCTNGHCVCDECFSKITICPQCRSVKSQGRCYALENIHSKVTLPCKYSKDGCNIRVLGAEIKLHEQYCRKGPKTCPLKDSHNCNWVGHYNKIITHGKKAHPGNVFTKIKESFTCRDFVKESVHHAYDLVFYAYREFFVLSWELVVAKSMVRWSLYHAGNPKTTKSFAFKLEFYNDDPEVSEYQNAKWMSPCFTNPNGNKADKSCMMISYDMLKNLCDNEGTLNYKIAIVRHKSGTKDELSESFCDLSVDE